MVAASQETETLANSVISLRSGLVRRLPNRPDLYIIRLDGSRLYRRGARSGDTIRPAYTEDEEVPDDPELADGGHPHEQ